MISQVQILGIFSLIEESIRCCITFTRGKKFTRKYGENRMWKEQISLSKFPLLSSLDINTRNGIYRNCHLRETSLASDVPPSVVSATSSESVLAVFGIKAGKDGGVLVNLWRGPDGLLCQVCTNCSFSPPVALIAWCLNYVNANPPK